MRRVLITGPQTVTVRHTDRPERGPDEVLVEVRACGLCAGEQRSYRGINRRYPFAGGHEVGGIVRESAHEDLTPGTVVAVSRLPRCKSCRDCLTGHDNRCAYQSGAMADADGPGGLVDFLVASYDDVAAVFGSPAQAAFAEPLACTLNSLHSLRLDSGAELAIIGNGFMGVLHARSAAAIGLNPILVETGPTPAGLEGAWGGRQVTFTEASEVLGPSSVDAAVVIREPIAGLALAGELARPGGVVSMFASVTPSMVVGLPAAAMRAKELAITATVAFRRREFSLASALISDRKVLVSDLIYRRFPIAEAEAAFVLSASCDSARIQVEPCGEE